MKRRIFSMILAAVMVFSSVDITAFAQIENSAEVFAVAEDKTIAEEGGDGENGQSGGAGEAIAEPTDEPTVEPIGEPTAAPAAEPTAEPTQAPAVTPTSDSAPVVTESPTETPEATETPMTQPISTENPTASPEATENLQVTEMVAEMSEATAEPTQTPTAAPELDAEELRITKNTTLDKDVKVGTLYIQNNYDLFLGGFNLEVYGDAEIYGDIDLGGGSLIIHGNVLHTNGGITFAGGSMTVDGDYHLEELKKDGTYSKGSGSFKMENSADILDVNGDFYCNSATNNLSAGTITFAGDVTILTMFKCTGTNKMIFDGAEKQNICFGTNNDQIYANELDIKNDKVVVERLSFAKLMSDATISADNADVWAYSNNTDINLGGHSFTVNGNLKLRGTKALGLDLAGGELIVNGNLLHSSGKVFLNGGKLKVSGDYRIETKETGDEGEEVYSSSSGFLVMANQQDILDVDGDFITNSSGSDYEMNAGTIYLAGDVRIAEGYFRGTGEHRTVLDGTDEQRVNIANSNSYFGKLDIQNQSTVIERIGFSKLMADATCSADDAVLWAGGKELSLGGHKLTLNSDVTVGIYQYFVMDLAGGELVVNGNLTHTAGDLVFNKGKLIINGDYRAATKVTGEEGESTYDDGHTALFMNYAEDYMDVNGDFTSDSDRNSWHELNAGVMEIAGDIQIIDRFFRGKGTHKLVLDGTEEQNIYMDHTDSYFNEVEFLNENVVIDKIGFCKLVSDAAITPNDAVIWTGGKELSLNGHKLTVNGDITFGIYGYFVLNLAGGELVVNGDFIHTSGDLVFNKGKLAISGDYRGVTKTVTEGGETDESAGHAALFMSYAEDYMDVDGDFISNSTRSANTELKAGIMELAGDVTICNTYFKFSDTHKVILDGNEKQTIIITSRGAFFNILQLTKKIDNYEFFTYGCWKKLIEAKDFLIKYVDTYYYTGQAIIPEVEVYEGKTLLEKDKDYTVSYKNNVKTNPTASGKKPPTIIVKGKGGYDGTSTATFKILKRDIADEEIIVEEFTASYNGTVLKKIPELSHNGKKLVAKTDFTVSYPDLFEGAYKEVGTHTVLLTGKGNYTGSREVTFTVTPVKFMKDVKVSAISSQPYTGAAVTLQTMKTAPSIKYGTTALTEGVHFTAEYKNNLKVGTATFTLTGTEQDTPEGFFKGTKTVTFKISGKSLAKAKVTGIPKTMTYNGQEINEKTEGWSNPIKVTLSGKPLTRAADEESAGDYVVIYEKNRNKGKATVTIKGVNNYTGSVKKTFTIAAYNISDNKAQNLVTEEMAPSIVFVKGGSKPEPIVKFGETVLTKGKDYTLTYKNNTKYHSGTGKSIPTVTVTGKGNFKGSVKLTFAIKSQDIGVCTLIAPDATYKKAKGAYKSSLVVKDVNGKALKSGTDFNVTYTYAQDVTTVNKKERKAGEAVQAADVVPAGTRMKVTVSGKGSYTAKNPLIAEYLVVKGSVANAKVTVPSQKYTGAPIIFENTPEDKAKIKVVIGKQKLKPEDFEIVDGSFENNTNAGTASFTIKGVGNYGGIKKVTFKITKRKFDAWWSVIFR